MKLSKLLEDVHQIRLLYESKGSFALVLRDLLQTSHTVWVLGGGLAVGYHAAPRGTQDIDIFLSSEQQLRHLKDDLNDKFHQIGPHALEHKSTGIEIETLTPEFLKIDQQIVDTAIRSAEMSDGIRVLSREGLVALKLMRANNRDKGDIEAIIQAGGPVSLDEYKLTSEQRQVYQALAEIVKHQQRLE